MLVTDFIVYLPFVVTLVGLWLRVDEMAESKLAELRIDPSVAPEVSRTVALILGVRSVVEVGILSSLYADLVVIATWFDVEKAGKSSSGCSCEGGFALIALFGYHALLVLIYNRFQQRVRSLGYPQYDGLVRIKGVEVKGSRLLKGIGVALVGLSAGFTVLVRWLLLG